MESEEMNEVVNIRAQRADVYIGRGSPWGNPFRIGPDGPREEVIEKYRQYLWQRIKTDPSLIDKLIALDGKSLGCYCAPLPCHGDVLAKAIAWAVAQRREPV